MNAPLLEKAVLLHNGDHLKQPEFHRRYLAHSGHAKIELIGGMVYVASRATLLHDLYLEELGFSLGTYRRATPGVELGHDATNILNEENEPRPDITMRIRTECGGLSRIGGGGYVEGACELLAEIAFSS